MQHVSFESSSLFHHSIYRWFICFPWWSIDELENLHADRTTVCFEPWQKPRARLSTRKTGLSPPPPRRSILIGWPFQGGFLTVTCSCRPYLYFGSAIIMIVTYFVKFRVAEWHLFGKELFIRFTASVCRKLLSVYVFSYFPFGFEGRMWDCLSFYLLVTCNIYTCHRLSLDEPF